MPPSGHGLTTVPKQPCCLTIKSWYSLSEELELEIHLVQDAFVLENVFKDALTHALERSACIHTTVCWYHSSVPLCSQLVMAFQLLSADTQSELGPKTSGGGGDHGERTVYSQHQDT